MAQPAISTDDIHVVIEDGEDNVQTLPSGDIAVGQDDGGVIIRLNPKQDNDPEIDDPSKFYANVADKLGEGQLMVIAMELYEAVGADDASRSEWLTNRADGMELLGLTLQDPSAGDGASAVDGQSVVTNPLLVEAVLKGWANAQAELLPAEGPCKVEDQGDQPTQQREELAECFERDMNYYLTTIAKEFAPQTSHMLLWGCYFGGSGFKKVFMHPLKKRPYSEKVSPEHLIVSDAMTDFEECERITHQITMRQSVMKRYQAKGIYRDIALAPPTPQPNAVDEGIAAQQGVALAKARPEDQPYTLWEIQCELDIDELAPKQFKGKGVPLPYLVTLDKDSQNILALRRDWKPEDEDCNRKRMYVKYPYVPGPGFYGTGLLNILGNSSAAMTAAWRLALDAAMFASFPSFLLDKLAGRQNTSDFRLSPGTAALIETGGRPLSDVAMGLPYKDPSAGLLGMIDKITQQAKETGGSPDVPVGEGMQNIPVGTMLAHIEQATKVMAAAHKGQHSAMDEELGLIADLFRESPESFWKGNKKAKGYWTVARLMRALDEYALTPKSDPNVPSHIHRIMKATALAELSATKLGETTLDPFVVMRRILGAMREDPGGGLLKAPPPPSDKPSPEEVTADAKMLEAKNKGKKAESDLKIAELKIPAEKAKAEAVVQGRTIDLAKTLAAHQHEQQGAQHEQTMDVAEHARAVRSDATDAEKATHDAMIDRGKLELEHRKVGLGEAQATHQMGLERDQHALEQQQAGHEMDVGQQKVGLEGQKLGIAQQQADTATHTALHPPKPAGGAKKKGKK